MFPDAAASSSLAFNGDRVNPLKVHSSAAATRQSRTRRRRGGEEERKGRRGEKTKRQSEGGGEKVQLDSGEVHMLTEQSRLLLGLLFALKCTT